MDRVIIGYVIFLASLYIESDPIYFSSNIWKTISLTVSTLFDEYIPKTDKVMALDIFLFDIFGCTLGRNGKGPQKALF